ncbi:Far-red elongated hypocotyl 1, putative isoform 2 [Hibiscus syriacus]|uniref:Far-red elongated hypocotyl 1, putative isoform 2 n=1 Tax=Hibiscus syriacus TaxID=106335 RepID=A0A6A3B8R2_HIBSY|nr:protein FAR-RED-ELONGATED HYPOCOTYL 1-LIKE-like [Hibiscus syriacus]KAE8713226.1 Far-red elongated hypocotyl 1, putative isoform 2 [Hibiscus syriacus]
MEIDNKKPNPSQIKSYLENSLIVVDINKKRKLEAEQLGLPLPKHQCWKQSLSLKPPSLCSVTEIEGFGSCTFKGKGANDYDVSKTELAKDSNSFAEDSDTAMSMHADAKCLLDNSASSSSPDWGSRSQCSHSDGTTVASSSVGKDVLSSPGDELETADARLAENLQETLDEYGDNIDYIYSGYGKYTIEQYQDKEIEEILNSDGANPNVYVLSSGRWSVNQEAPETKRKPTIDQEFEQYFSTLML